MKKALVLASVVSMIDLFNIENIKILQYLGYDVHVACNFEKGSTSSKEKVISFRNKLLEMNVSFHHLPIPRSIFKVGDILSSKRKLDMLLKNNSFDIIHCHSPIGGVIARSSSKNYRSRGLKVIYTAHGFHFFRGAPVLNWFLFYPIEKHYSKYTDLLITMNEEDYQLARKKLQANKTVKIPGVGIDTEMIAGYQNDILNLREHFGIKETDFVLLSVGQLSKRKNHEIVIEAIASLNEKRIKYIICGTGELREKLERLAERLGIAKQVIFAGFQQDVYGFLKMADSFVIPSKQEGLPVSLMEAMATPLPIVCSDIRGNRDLIRNKRNGLVVSVKDQAQYEKAIVSLFLDKPLREEIKKNNLSDIEKFDQKNVNQIMTELYKMF